MDVRAMCAIGWRGQLGLHGRLPWEGETGPEFRADVERFWAATRGHVLLAGPATFRSIPTFAHAGDGNLHPSVIVPTDDADSRQHAERILDRITDAALALGGTISGEHGIGSLKRHALGKQLDLATLATHRVIKNAFDPHHILSPDRGI